LIQVAKTEDEPQKDTDEKKAAEQFEQYFNFLTNDKELAQDDLKNPREAVNEYADFLLATDNEHNSKSRQLCDEFDILARSGVPLFDWDAIEKWNTTLRKTDNMDDNEYCEAIKQQSDLRTSARNHRDLASRCRI